MATVCLAGCTVERPQPNLVGQDIRLTIIHTSDIHSRLFPYNFVPNTFDQDYGLLPANAPFGGIARIATLVKRIRRDSNRSLWLDSGDAFQGAPVFNMFKGEAEMRALSLAGMDAEVLGNHEFDLGATNLYEKIDTWSQFPHLAANYAWDDSPTKSRSLRDVVQPYQIFDVDGLRVAVVGMGNEDTLSSIYEGGNSLGFRPIENTVALEQWTRFLRPQVDLIVVVSHVGLDADEGLTASEVEDQNVTVPGVDLILGGHLHIVTNPPKLLPNDDGSEYCKSHDCQTLLVHSGAFAKYVGRLDLVVHVGTDNSDPEKRSRIVSFAYKNIPVDSTIPEDADVANLMWPYSVKLNQEIDLNGVFAWVAPGGTSGTEKILRNDQGGGDSQLGNLVARSMQVQQGVDAEFAITNSLGIRADFERGALTNEQMFNVFPFENSITVMYLSGQEVQDTLDFVARKSASRGCRTQAQVAGITFDMVCKGDCPSIDPFTNQKATACAKNVYIGEDCRNGNPDGPIDPTKCAPLSLSGLYRVAVNDYIAGGGSGFIVLKRNTSQQNTGISLRDALTVYLNQQQQVCNTGVACDASTPCPAPETCTETPRGSFCTLGTDKIIDTTDTQTPQRSVKQRWGNISCLDGVIEQHDGRIRPVFE
ncbi:MAG TPA: bifunctional UDP-sugar hydrolase/5'-nucleotidase [Kofleriaceae bacterium]|nr:bifunctional UDP-sugar hydrolase/5'-nucleotidase [Kofleriaceae bacterium]